MPSLELAMRFVQPHQSPIGTISSYRMDDDYGQFTDAVCGRFVPNVPDGFVPLAVPAKP